MARYDLSFKHKGRPPGLATLKQVIKEDLDKTRFYKQAGATCTVLSSLSKATLLTALSSMIKAKPKYKGGVFVKAEVTRAVEEDEEDEA